MSAAAVSRTKHCVYCRRPETEVGKLSGRGNCGECGMKALIENVQQLNARSGPRYEYFVKRRAAIAARRLRELANTATG